MCYILLHFCKLCSTLFTNMPNGTKINAQEIGRCSWKKVNYGNCNLDLDVGIWEKFCKAQISLVISRVFLLTTTSYLISSLYFISDYTIHLYLLLLTFLALGRHSISHAIYMKINLSHWCKFMWVEIMWSVYCPVTRGFWADPGRHSVKTNLPCFL